MKRPDQMILPEETASEHGAVGIQALLYDVLVVTDSTDPLVEVVVALADAGMRPRAIASRLDIAERLVEHLLGLGDRTGSDQGPAYEARRALQDIETGTVWRSGDTSLETIPARWLDDGRCRPQRDGLAREDRSPLLVLEPTRELPPPPSIDHLTAALEVAGARLVGPPTPVVVRARAVATLHGVGVLAPFSGIAEPALRDLLHANTGSSRVADLIDRLRDGDVDDHVSVAHAEFRSLAKGLATRDGRLSAAQRRNLVDAARRVVIAAASDFVGDDPDELSVGGLFARGQTVGPEFFPFEAAQLLRRLRDESDAAALAVISALDTIITRAEARDHALLPLAQPLLLGFARSTQSSLSRDLERQGVRERVATLTETIDQLVTTLRRTEIQDVA